MPAENNQRSGGGIPIARPVRPRPAGWWVRGGLLGGAAALAVVFGLARAIDPYRPDGTARTMSTHTQLGLAPCNFVELTGRPCPSCGMTTSFALLARGDLGGSARANWVGTLLAVAWAGLLVWAVAAGVRGRLWPVPPGRAELWLTLLVGAFLVLMLGRWGAVLLQR